MKLCKYFNTRICKTFMTVTRCIFYVVSLTVRGMHIHFDGLCKGENCTRYPVQQGRQLTLISFPSAKCYRMLDLPGMAVNLINQSQNQTGGGYCAHLILWTLPLYRENWCFALQHKYTQGSKRWVFAFERELCWGYWVTSSLSLLGSASTQPLLREKSKLHWVFLAPGWSQE